MLSRLHVDRSQCNYTIARDLSNVDLRIAAKSRVPSKNIMRVLDVVVAVMVRSTLLMNSRRCRASAKLQ